MNRPSSPISAPFGEPAAPAEPAAPVEPAEPAAPVAPPAEPAEPAEPAAPVEPAEPAAPAGPAADDPFNQPPAPEKKKPAGDDPFDPSTNNLHQMRTWSDLTGNYKIEAKFVSVVDGNAVRLQMANGRYFRIKLDMLCRADHAMVVRHMELIASAF